MLQDPIGGSFEPVPGTVIIGLFRRGQRTVADENLLVADRIRADQAQTLGLSQGDQRVVLGGVEPDGAHFEDGAVEFGRLDGPGTPSGAVAGFQHDRPAARFFQRGRRSEAGRTGAYDDNVGFLHGSSRARNRAVWPEEGGRWGGCARLFPGGRGGARWCLGGGGFL